MSFLIGQGGVGGGKHARVLLYWDSSMLRWGRVERTIIERRQQQLGMLAWVTNMSTSPDLYIEFI